MNGNQSFKDLKFRNNMTRFAFYSKYFGWKVENGQARKAGRKNIREEDVVIARKK